MKRIYHTGPNITSRNRAVLSGGSFCFPCLMEMRMTRTRMEKTGKRIQPLTDRELQGKVGKRFFSDGKAGPFGFFGKILPNGVEIFSKTEGSTFYFQSPLPYLCTCTITVDAKRKDHVEERKSERQMKIKTSRKFLDCTIIAYSFLRNGYNYCLANVFRKMVIAYKNGTVFREIPMKEEYGLSMLLASGFLQGCAAKHESGR